MKLRIIQTSVAIILIAVNFASHAQSKFLDKTCNVSFVSTTPLEKIEGNNTSAISVLDIATGAMEFAVLIKAFEFRQALLQEHFNENYMESEQFPKASFKGQIKDNTKVDYKTDGTYPVDVAGTLTIHGVSKQITTQGNIKVVSGNIQGLASFSVKPEDYNIAIPGVVKDKIAKDIAITVEANYVPYLKQ